MELQGLLSALVTPFTTDGEVIDETRLRSLVDEQVAAGAHGLITCGSTGEFATLSHDERRQVTEIVLDQTAGRVPVVPQIGALTAKEAISLGKHAEQAGAAAVLTVAPFYEPLTEADALRYHRSAADALGVPTMIYNIPLHTGVNIGPELIGQLAAEVEQIKYVKDTSLDMHQAEILIQEYGDVVKTFVGLDTLYLVSLLAGGAGAINGAANIVPAELVAIWDAVQAGDLARAREVWDQVYPVMKFLTDVPYNAAVKAGLDILGRSAGDPRLPATPLPLDERGPLEAALSKLAVS